MRILLIICALCAAGQAGVPFMQYKEGDRFFVFPDDNGKMHLVDSLATDENVQYDTRNVAAFWLFTRNNRNSAQILTTEATIGSSLFLGSRQTKIIVHGWNGNGASAVNTLIRDRLLNQLDCNVIVVDWRGLANGLYNTAVNGVPNVANSLAAFVNLLIRRGAALSRIHLIGFSLGGHIVGITGRNLGGGVQRISGMDPAGPLWGSNSARIRPSDGRYVEIIHTNAGYSGIWDPVGHADFYPNGGTTMPGCGTINVACSHGRSYEYFAEAVSSSRFVGRRCNNVNEATSSRCTGSGTLVMGGAGASKSGSGIFHMTTNANSPFAQG